MRGACAYAVKRPEMSTFRNLLITEMGRYKDHLLRLDRSDRHMRFGGTVSDAVIEQHCLRMDWRNTVVVAYVDGGEIRAAVELRTSDRTFDRPFPERAEAAFSVERAYQGRGLGTALMRRVLTVASNRGVRIVDVLCLLENRRMQALARKFARAVVVEGGEVGITIGVDRPSQVSLMLEAFEEGAGLMLAMLDRFRVNVERVLH